MPRLGHPSIPLTTEVIDPSSSYHPNPLILRLRPLLSLAHKSEAE